MQLVWVPDGLGWVGLGWVWVGLGRDFKISNGLGWFWVDIKTLQLVWLLSTQTQTHLFVFRLVFKEKVYPEIII